MNDKTERTLIITVGLVTITVIFIIFGFPKIMDNQYLKIQNQTTENVEIITETETEEESIPISNYLSGSLPDREPMVIDGTEYNVPLQDGPYCAPHSPTGTEATHTYHVVLPKSWILIIDSVSTVIDGKTYNSQLLVLENPFTGDITVTNGALCGGPIEWQKPLEKHRLEVLSLFVKDPQVSYK